MERLNPGVFTIDDETLGSSARQTQKLSLLVVSLRNEASRISGQGLFSEFSLF
ncbi:MAG: hypothetical protein ACI85F_001408 [Bacteroidia bacterium]|jgi:hypothetical protein